MIRRQSDLAALIQSVKASIVERFVWVDVLRGLAAVVIAVFHYHHFYLANAYDRPTPPMTHFLMHLSSNRYIAGLPPTLWSYSG